MYKLLILTLASPHLSTVNFKQVLSEISEVLVCILRQESELLTGSLFTNVEQV